MDIRYFYSIVVMVPHEQMSTLLDPLETIHQIWFSFENGRSPTITHQKCMTAWKDMYSDYKLWEWDQAQEWVTSLYPMFQRFFQDLTRAFPIVKCDVFRLLVLYHYGGIYADLDVYPLRKIEFQDHVVSEIILTDEWYKSSQLTQTVHNAIMISRRRRNPFWLSLALTILRAYHRGEYPRCEDDVYKFSGPKFMWNIVNMHRHLDPLRIVVLPYCYFCPFDIRGSGGEAIPMNGEDSQLHPGAWMYPKVELDNIKETLTRYPNSFTIFVCQVSLWK